MNEFNLLKKKINERQLMQLCIWEKRSDEKKMEGEKSKKMRGWNSGGKEIEKERKKNEKWC